MHYVYSTMTASVDYPVYVKGGGDMPDVAGSVMIYGGANSPDKYMRTPEGAVITPVTDEQLENLMRSPVFALHKQNGFLKVSDKKTSGEKAAADMEGRDASAPLVEQDFIAEGKAPPKTGKIEEDDRPKPTGRRA